MKSSDIPRDELQSAGRRRFIGLAAGVFAVAALPAVVRRRERMVRRSVPMMGTIADFSVIHASERYAHAAIDAAVAELRGVERTLTRFSPLSEIGRVNAGPRGRPTAVSPGTAAVVEDALRWAALTGGSFDPAIGGAVELWSDRTAPPPHDAVEGFAGRALYVRVEVGHASGAPAILLHDPGARLDLGGIGKGHGVDRAAQTLREWGIASAIVNVGGDLYAIGTAADGAPWRVGIQSPDDSNGIIGVLEVSDAAVATSGTYRQFFRHRGERYHHLLDPSTGAPRATAVRSITIKAPSCMEADAAATAAFGLPSREIAALLVRSGRGAELVDIA